MKACYRCSLTKPLSEFYKHPGTKDGYLGKCKVCAISDIKQYRKNNIEHYHTYDIARAKTDARKAHERERSKKWKLKYPERDKAHEITSNAIRDGRLIPQVCFVCGGAPTEAHHPDYSHPYDVVWLCKKHHEEVHHSTSY